VVVALSSLKIIFFLSLLVGLGLLSRYALHLESTPRELDAETERQISPVSEILSGRDRLVGMDLEHDGLKMSFGLRDNGWWWMILPETTMPKQLEVSQWVSALTRPRVQRVILPEEWSPTAIEFSLTARLVGLETHSTVVYFRLKSQKDFYYLQLENGSVLKAELQIRPFWPTKIYEFRTLRLFPFETGAVDAMTAEMNSYEREWQRDEQEWTSRGELTDWWRAFFKDWLKSYCQSFIEDFQPKSSPLATWEIRFVEGNVAHAELYRDELGQWIFTYRGRKVAQVIDEEMARRCFPLQYLKP
jgi:hypothetical protein